MNAPTRGQFHDVKNLPKERHFALPPRVLSTLITKEITALIDDDALAEVVRGEERDKRMLREMLERAE